jgi:hypothetical protein
MTAELDAGTAARAAVLAGVHAVGNGARTQPQRGEPSPVEGGAKLDVGHAANVIARRPFKPFQGRKRSPVALGVAPFRPPQSSSSLPVQTPSA